MAANARIGVAKAAYFPDISLTGVGGFQSIPLTQLFTGPYGMWNFTGQLAQPLYAGGTLKGGVRLAQAQQQEAELNYQRDHSAGVSRGIRRAYCLRKGS